MDLKKLTDKQYDRRKLAAQEIEKLYTDYEKSRDLVEQLKQLLHPNSSTNQKSGGCLGLTSICMATEVPKNDLNEWMVLVMGCFDDLDPKMRFYACESLYNIIKHTKYCILHTTIDNIAKLASDPDTQCRLGAELLDRLLKDVLLDLDIQFQLLLPVISERMYAIHPNVRNLMLSWLQLLITIPNNPLIEYLPLLLATLFKYTSDDNEEIRTATIVFLNNIIKDVTSEHVDMLLPLILPFVSNEDELTTCTALDWLSHFIDIAPLNMIQHCNILLDVLLTVLSSPSTTINAACMKVNSKLYSLLQSAISNQQLGVGSSMSAMMDGILSFVQLHLSSAVESTKLVALQWMLMIYQNTNLKVDKAILKQLFALLNDTESVINYALHVLANLADTAIHYELFINDVLMLFSNDRRLLEVRGVLILNKLLTTIGPKKFLLGLNKALAVEEDLEMATTMVQNVNLILITSPDLKDLRKDLQELNDLHFFTILYKAWSHHPIALFSLLLICQLYEHACDVLNIFSEIEITVNFLIQLDKLVQLIESPIFTFLRLQLLDNQNIYLYKALYGLLMILPQSSAFATLRTRLHAINNINYLQDAYFVLI
eukprot:NODE_91_length_21779_cov_0.171356.p1 type:complete len:599 gc:universal NODE_91_length_21779_cov_0.171356:18344-16548(-)